MVGVASHIRAASKGGPRFDATMTSAERKNIKNGIWLCQADAKLIDDDEAFFTVAFLEQLKADHESDVRERVSSGSVDGKQDRDEEILAAIATVLDRPAMTEPFGSCRQGHLQKALSDTIETLNTGVHRLRDGTEIKRFPSRHELRDKTARDTVDELVGMLGELRALHARLIEAGTIRSCGCSVHPPTDALMDDLRRRVLDAFRRIKPDFNARIQHDRW